MKFYLQSLQSAVTGFLLQKGKAMGKYDPLYNYLSKKTDTTITLRFSEIESIIGDELPASAHKYPEWWSNSKTDAHPYSHAWLDAGYKTVDVFNGIGKQEITFEKIL